MRTKRIHCNMLYVPHTRTVVDTSKVQTHFNVSIITNKCSMFIAFT